MDYLEIPRRSLIYSTLQVQIFDEETEILWREPLWLLHEDFTGDCSISLMILSGVVLIFRASHEDPLASFATDLGSHIH